MICVDASVFVAGVRPAEVSHLASIRFLKAVYGRATPLCAPSLVLPESAAAITRNTGRAELGRRLVEHICSFESLQIISIDESLAIAASEIASTHRLRGADAIYVALAVRYNALLVTLDQEMLQRGSNVVDVRPPDRWEE